MEPIRQGDIPGVQLRRRVEISGADPAAVWPFWLEEDRLALWLCDRARFEAGPPRVAWLETESAAGGTRREYAEFFEQIEARRLVLGWRRLDAGWTAATRLTMELSARSDGCEVMVFQEGFQQLPLSIGLTAWEESRARWQEALARLAPLVGV